MNCNAPAFLAMSAARRHDLTRRTFLQRAAGGIGLAALGSLLNERATAATGALPGRPHLPPKAKRIIYLFQSGAPSQMDLFDPKPALVQRRGEDLPASIRQGQRLTTMTSGQKSFPVAPSIFNFAKHGQSGAQFSELMPHMSGMADGWAIIRSLHTEANYGRDHHPRCYTVLIAGTGVKKGITYGATDDYCCNVTENPVHVHDLNATILHLMGVNHERLTYRYQGRDFRLTDIHGELVKAILA